MAIYQQLDGAIDEVRLLSLPQKPPVRGHRESGDCDTHPQETGCMMQLRLFERLDRSHPF
jgi:hypothetical protein